jgi:hypothetical protein
MFSNSDEPEKKGWPKQMAENGTDKAVNGTINHQCGKLKTIKEAARNECLPGLYCP